LLSLKPQGFLRWRELAASGGLRMGPRSG